MVNVGDRSRLSSLLFLPRLHAAPFLYLGHRSSFLPLQDPASPSDAPGSLVLSLRHTTKAHPLSHVLFFSLGWHLVPTCADRQLSDPLPNALEHPCCRPRPAAHQSGSYGGRFLRGSGPFCLSSGKASFLSSPFICKLIKLSIVFSLTGVTVRSFPPVCKKFSICFCDQWNER